MRSRSAMRLPYGMTYRLPGGDEWLKFAQCGDGRTYPWGDHWPPKFGNYGVIPNATRVCVPPTRPSVCVGGSEKRREFLLREAEIEANRRTDICSFARRH